jgi:S1-C subfamily serine protease
VKSFDDLVGYLARNTEVGQKLTLTVLRGGQRQRIEVTLTERPAAV